MRIIAGKYRGRKLKSPPSLETRPTSDRLRETLFNILAPRIEDALFLDLCAGTGAVGIEALSRGAAHVTFVDQSRKMCGLIEENLKRLKTNEQEAEVVLADVTKCLGRHVEKGARPFDLVYFDPPYAADYEAVLHYAGQHSAVLFSEGGLMIVEHQKKKDLLDEFGAWSATGS